MDKKTKIYLWALGGVILIMVILIILGITLNPKASAVNFRTSNLFYGGNSMIAYSSVCGNILDKYGVSSGLGYSSSGDCTSAKGYYGLTTITYIMDVPGRVTEDGIDDGRTSKKTSLFKDDTYDNYLYVCSDLSTGGYLYLMYTKDAQVSGVDISDSKESINPTMEGRC